MGEIIVMPEPAIGQVLGISQRGEQLGVEEFITEPAVLDAVQQSS